MIPTATIGSLRTTTYAFFLFDLVIGLVDPVQVLEMQLHQPVYLLMVVLDELVDQTLPLNAVAILHQRSHN